MKLGVLSIGDADSLEVAERAATAERVGYDYFWLADERFFREPFQLLALAARLTSRITLGPCIVDPYTRHPALIATAAGTLDEISGGRATVVLGAGKSGFREMDVVRTHPARRLREAVVLIRQLCVNKTADFDGREVVFRDGQVNMPLRESLPIWIATERPVALAVAGGIADAVMVSSAGTRDQLIAVRSILEDAGRKVGREPIELHLRIDVAVSDKPNEAEAVVRPLVLRHLLRHLDDQAFLTQNSIEPELVERLQRITYRGYSRDADSLGAAAETIPIQYLGRFAWRGSEQQIASAAIEVSDLVDGVTVFPLLVSSQSWDVAVTRIREAFALAERAAELERTGRK